MSKLAIIFAAVTVCHVHAVSYRLYTRANQNSPENILMTAKTLPDVFEPKDNTIILIHGHRGSPTDDFNTMIMREIFRFEDLNNVIVVDWEEGARHSYGVAVSYVPSVARDLANFISWLASLTVELEGSGDIDLGGLEPREVDPLVNIVDTVVRVNKLHLIGFGLGAHIAGISSRQLRDSLGIVGRITGLDPSGSQWNSNSQRLRQNDARYVEVIHTDGSGLLANGIGTAIGQVNFYANGGSNQPGCFSHSCSHNRAYELFAASIRGHLYGNACSSTTQMNLNLCRGTQLILGGTALSKASYSITYRVNTRRNFPF